MSKNLENWFRVEISDIQGQVVAIETEMLCGRDIGESEEKAIKSAIENLSSFIGYRRALPDEDGWVSVKRDPDIETLRRMAEELRLITKGQILNSDWFTILQRQYRAAIAASPKPPEPQR